MLNYIYLPDCIIYHPPSMSLCPWLDESYCHPIPRVPGWSMWNIFTSSSEVGLRLRVKLATPEKCSNCTKNGEIWQFIAEIWPFPLSLILLVFVWWWFYQPGCDSDFILVTLHWLDDNAVEEVRDDYVWRALLEHHQCDVIPIWLFHWNKGGRHHYLINKSPSSKTVGEHSRDWKRQSKEVHW